MQPNSLYFGDNLKVLSDRKPDGTYIFPSESVELVYLDPPFNSNRDYSVIFKEQSGEGSDAQIKAFTDSWQWGPDARDALEELTVTGVNSGRIPEHIGRLMDALVRGIGHNDMSAYLVMMTPRLVQLHRVLKESGSLYLHCDPTASHYLKIILDAVFGPRQFRNELVWKRTSAHSDAKRYARVHDSILFYSKTDSYTWNQSYLPLPQKTIDDWYNNVEPETGRRFNRADLTAAGVRQGVSGKPWRGIDPTAKGNHWRVPRFLPELTEGKTTQEALDALDEAGRIFWPKAVGGIPMLKRYLDEATGIPLLDVISDISPLQNMTKERLGYPTQKPLALLERLIAAASNPGDTVLDPFCGCGTALIAAEKLKRQWIGIDITHLSIAVMRARLMDSFGLADVPVHGVPEDLESARMLAAESKDGRYEFQWWALAKIDARPLGGTQKKGADKGIDGVMTFSEQNSIQRILVSVKSGKPSVLHVKELMATLTDQGGAIGVLIELDPPTTEMKLLAVNAGQYTSELWGGGYERIQILTVADLLAGTKPAIPKFLPAYQKAAKIAADAGEQQALWQDAHDTKDAQPA